MMRDGRGHLILWAQTGVMRALNLYYGRGIRGLNSESRGSTGASESVKGMCAGGDIDLKVPRF